MQVKHSFVHTLICVPRREARKEEAKELEIITIEVRVRGSTNICGHCDQDTDVTHCLFGGWKRRISEVIVASEAVLEVEEISGGEGHGPCDGG